MHYLDFMELVEERFSVRSFTDQPVDPISLQRILHAGHVAPTACNNQPQRIYVIESEEGLRKLKNCTTCHFNAPLALLVCYDKYESWRRPYDGQDSGFIDAAIVATHMMLQAASEEVGCTWVMHFSPEGVREEFDLPESIVPVALLPMGYPSPKAHPASGHLFTRPMGETVIRV